MKKTFALFTGIIFILSAFVSPAQESWSLQKCIDYALENNIQIKQQGLNTQYNENQVSQAKSDRLPNLNASLSNRFNFGRSLTYENTYENVNSTQIDGYLGTEITLWNGSILSNTIRQRELDLQAAIQDLKKTKDDIILNIAAAYLEILFAEELELIAEAQTEVTRQQIERTKKLVDAGSLARGSLLEIEAQLAREELQLVNDQNRVQLAYLSLFQFLELPVEKSFKIEKPQLPEIKANVTMANSFDVFKNAMNVRPEIKAAQLRVESARRQLDIAKGSRFPSLNFGASYYNLYNNKYADMNDTEISFNDQLSNNQRYAMGFSLDIPIFNKSQVKNGISNAALKIQDFEYQLQTSRNLLRKDIEQAYTNALAALNKFISSEKAVKSTEEAFRYTEEKFNVGMINSVEYNQSKNYLTVAQSELLQAKYEYIFRTKILDFYNGVPIEL
ncbi:TolC family protein [Mariniphaga sediminis]|jgi:outer membrane protein|uniref:TolC family protein n=1 Tax=Mariniphaga sediminis TaxID=1628158 RepID=A0A399D5K3_9BACT|nr:TolC family protein [Mariniphaga sediminis]RIH65942.1 TolC family protein [Mariniphaga sediminis]